MKFNSTSKTPGVKPKVTPSIQQQVINNSPKKLTPQVQQKILGTPKVQPQVKPRIRKETQSEYTERTLWENEDTNMPKPKHMDNPLIVSEEDWGKRPKPFKNDDPSTYPVNQKKNLSTWEIMVDQAKNPKDSYDRESAKQVRQTILDSWKNPTMRKYLGEDELELIGRGRKQLEEKRKREEENMKERPVYVEPPVYEPVPKLKDYMREKAGFQPGITKDFIQLQTEIKKNMDYVMGKDHQKEESKESVSSENDKYKEVEID